MLVDLFMFVLVRSGEEPLVGTQTHWIMFYHRNRAEITALMCGQNPYPVSLWRTSFSGYATHGPSLASLHK